MDYKRRAVISVQRMHGCTTPYIQMDTQLGCRVQDFLVSIIKAVARAQCWLLKACLLVSCVALVFVCVPGTEPIVLKVCRERVREGAREGAREASRGGSP